MPRFKPGQEVVCISRSWWIPFRILFWKIKRQTGYGPKYNEIVTIEAGSIDIGYTRILEYSAVHNGERYAYAESCFEPVVSQEDIEELVEETLIFHGNSNRWPNLFY